MSERKPDRLNAEKWIVKLQHRVGGAVFSCEYRKSSFKRNCSESVEKVRHCTVSRLHCVRGAVTAKPWLRGCCMKVKKQQFWKFSTYSKQSLRRYAPPLFTQEMHWFWFLRSPKNQVYRNVVSRKKKSSGFNFIYLLFLQSAPLQLPVLRFQSSFSFCC